jgi:hypothetical protein
MRGNQLQKAIDLVKKTGDRLIVFDKAESNNPYVVMSLDDYEKLVVGKSEVRGLTEGELIDKINRDIAIWKSENDFSGFSEENEFKHPISSSKGSEDDSGFDEDDNHIEDYNYNEDDIKKDDTEIEDMYKNDLSSPGLKRMSESSQNKKRSNNWSIPFDRKQAAEEVVEEDRQYLEEIPF